MLHLLIVILDDLAILPALLTAWQAVGVPGVTILQSAGAYRTQTWLGRVGLGAIDRLFESDEVRRRTLLAAIEDDDLLKRAIAEAERLTGGFDRPNSGLLLVLPVLHARGLHKTPAAREPLNSPGAVQPGWLRWRNEPVEAAAAILNLEPVVVGPDTRVDQIHTAMLAQPNVHVVCVVAEDSRLIGLLRLQDLVDALFFHVMPEEFFNEVTDLEHAMQFAEKSRVRTAADVMKEPVWVKQGETIKVAFKRMHEQQLSGLPIVDETYHVTGYINLLELLAAVCCHEPGRGTGDTEGEEPN
jgi:CBS domain-containing protein